MSPSPLSPRYYPFSRFLRQRFGAKVYRVTVDGGFTCPNVDGTAAYGGCVYCDNRSFSPNRRLPRVPIREQVRRGRLLCPSGRGREDDGQGECRDSLHVSSAPAMVHGT